MKRTVSVTLVALLSLWMVTLAPSPASAHLHDQFGNVGVTVGWINEPAFAGEPNGVQVFLEEAAAEPAGEHTHDEATAETKPVAANQVKLTVEIMFGEQDATVKLPAQPLEAFSFGEPGEWRSEQIVPTRPGTYTFHISGTIKGKAFDKFYTSGEKGAIEGTQYNDIREIAAVSFPEKDPPSGELADAIEQSRTTLAASAKKASDDAKNARLFGIIGIGVGVLGLIVGLRPRGKKAAS